MRDSLEDYDYIWLLEQKIGRTRALEYVNKLATSWTSYTDDPNHFQSIRDEIARMIDDQAPLDF